MAGRRGECCCGNVLSRRVRRIYRLLTWSDETSTDSILKFFYKNQFQITASGFYFLCEILSITFWMQTKIKNYRIKRNMWTGWSCSFMNGVWCDGTADVDRSER